MAAHFGVVCVAWRLGAGRVNPRGTVSLALMVLFAFFVPACRAAFFGGCTRRETPRGGVFGSPGLLRRLGGVRGATAVLAKLQTAPTADSDGLRPGRSGDEERFATELVQIKQTR